MHNKENAPQPQRFRLEKYGVTRKQWLDAVAQGKRWCCRCHTFKNLGEFDGKNRSCRPCALAYGREWHARNREKRNQKARNYYRKNQDRLVKYSRDYWNALPPAERKRRHRAYKLKSAYGFTEAEWQAMLRKQKRRCAVCHKPEAVVGPLRIDHKHGTKKVRGALCNGCNVFVGFLEKRIGLVRKAEAYLALYR